MRVLLPTAPDCDIFCRVVDNYGDAAVCWRLARALQLEQGFRVRLVIDRVEVLAALQPAVDPALDIQAVDGVTVERAAPGGGSATAAAAVVIDAFGGGLPDGYAQALARHQPPGLWTVLEYLSAEPWVAGLHRMPSPHPSLAVRRFFFFPGFGPDTGGLLRERGLVEARQAFDDDPGSREGFWQALGQRAPAASALKVSLFGYENAVLAPLLDAMAQARQPTVVALAPGPLAEAATGWLAARGGRIKQGSAFAGRLELRALPFLPQPGYDDLLRVCDLNFVRGEDSLVRAIWAARPLVWQLYPQLDCAHLAKLEAFLATCSAGQPSAALGALDALATLHRVWNAGTGAGPAVAGAGRAMAEAWGDVASALPMLSRQARRFSDEQAAAPDLAARLAAFCRDQLK